MMKKIVLAMVMLLFTTNLWAARVVNVSATIHNMASGNTAFPFYTATNEDEVCIFCHTPHGGRLNTQLWNRSIPVGTAGTFTHYTSATLSAYMRGPLMATRAVNPESLLCMSCHDGTVAMNNIINASNRTGSQPDGSSANPLITVWGWGLPGIGAVIGDAPDAAGVGQGLSTNLTDDHPISFSYSSALASSAAGKLDTLANAKLDGVRFFGGDRVECSSCHDPHVNGNAISGGDPAYFPFLTTPNTASALCLACHTK